MAQPISKADIVADLERVAAELGHPPTYGEYREHGAYSVPTVAKHFDGSFTNARASVLGCPDERRAEIHRGDLLADIERVADIVGREPSKDDYYEHGEYALSTITYRFDSWIDAKKEAGVYEGATRERLIADLQRVDAEHDGPVSQVVYNEHGKWHNDAVKRRFGSWEKGCQKAGVTRPNMGPRTEATAELLEDIRRVAQELGHPPSRGEYHKRGKFTRQMAKDRCGSWPEAVRRAGYEPRKPGAQPGELNGYWKGGYEPYYGSNWHEQRRAARRRDEYRCAACGMEEAEHVSEFGWGLEVHHIAPVRTFDEPEAANELGNLVTLCRPHHHEFEKLSAGEVRERLEGGSDRSQRRRRI